MHQTTYQLLLAISLVLTSIASGRSVHSRNKRMINGDVASINDWPFIASLKYSNSSNVLWKVCSASLINRNLLVTVAHCVKDENKTVINPKHLKVQLRRSSDSWETEDYEVSQISANPPVKTGDFLEVIGSDFALIKLKRNAPSHVSTARIHEGGDNVQNCRSAGWGTTSLPENGQKDMLAGNYQISESLLSINVTNVVSWSGCFFVSYFRHSINTNSSYKFFCAGEMGVKDPNGQHACFGDSGSPLVCDGTSGPVLYGLLLGGSPDCVPGSKHMVFVDVSKHREWINEVAAGPKLAKD